VHPTHSDPMRQKKCIGVQEMSLVPLAEGGQLQFSISHDDSAATNGTVLYLGQKRGVTQEGILISEMENAGTVYHRDSGNAYSIPIVYHPVEDLTFTVKHDADPASNQGANEVYAVPTGTVNEWGVQEAVLYGVNVQNADADLEDDDSTDAWVIHDNDNTATMELQGTAMKVYFDDDGDPSTSRLLVDNPTGADLYVASKTGRPLKITHSSSADSEPPLFFDDGGSAGSFLYFVDPGTSNSDFTSGTQLGWWHLHGWWLGQVYVNPDADAHERFLVNIPAGQDSRINLMHGNRAIEMHHDASASSNGIAVYVDDDGEGGGAYAQFLYVDDDGSADTYVETSPLYMPTGATLVSAGTNNAPLVEIGTTGIAALQMEQTDDVRRLMCIPSDWDRDWPIYVRIIWASEQDSYTNQSITWKVMYDALVPGTDAVGNFSTALDTALVLDPCCGTAKSPQKSATAGKIDGKTIANAETMIEFFIELETATNIVPATTNIYLIGIEFEYTPKTSYLTNHREAWDWRA